MKYIILIAFFLGLACSTELLHVQVSAISNIKKKFKVLNEMKEFVGCEPTKETLIHPICLIEGITEEKDSKKLCDEYTKDLEKSLDCKKDTCEDFYKKLNKANIKYAEAQAKYFKGKKDKEREERCKTQAKDQKDQEEAFVKSHCFADMSGAFEQKEDDKKKK